MAVNMSASKTTQPVCDLQYQTSIVLGRPLQNIKLDTCNKFFVITDTSNVRESNFFCAKHNSGKLFARQVIVIGTQHPIGKKNEKVNNVVWAHLKRHMADNILAQKILEKFRYQLFTTPVSLESKLLYKFYWKLYSKLTTSNGAHVSCLV